MPRSFSQAVPGPALAFSLVCVRIGLFLSLYKRGGSKNCRGDQRLLMEVADYPACAHPAPSTPAGQRLTLLPHPPVRRALTCALFIGLELLHAP